MTSTPAPTTATLERPDGTLAFELHGTTGPLVVCLPGLGDDRSAYRDVAAQLATAGYRVATLDLRGQGESTAVWPSYTQRAIASDALALAAQLGGGPTVFVGHSYTPDSALAAAVDADDRVDVRGVVAIGTWATTPKLNPVMGSLTGVILRTPALWGVFLRSLHKGRRPADLDQRIRRIVAGLRRSHGTDGLRAMGDRRNKDAEGARAENTAPVLIVMGSLDPDFADPAAEARTYAEAVTAPNEIVMVPETGHYPHVQHPEAVVAAMRTFLARVAPVTAGDRA